MKFAFCLFKYFPYGGLQRDFLRIADECIKRGHEVHAFASEWDGAPPQHLKVTVLKGTGIFKITNHAQNQRFHRKLRTELENQQFDAVVGFNKMPDLDVYYGADFCYIGRSRYRHRPWYRILGRYRRSRDFEKAVFGRASKTVVLSLSEREKSVYQQFYFTDEERFHLLPPTLDNDRRPVDDRTRVRHTMRDKLTESEDDNLLLFIGSGFETKGLDRAITALANLPEQLRLQTRLAVIGEDKPGRKLRWLIRRLGLTSQVRFLGPRGDIPELLSAGDLLVHPAYQENTGTVLLEAIAAGLPVLTTDVCGYAKHITEARAGRVLASPFEQTLLDDALSEMLTSPEREAWAKNGLAYGKDPSLYRMPVTAVDLIENHCQTLRISNTTTVEPTEDQELYFRDDLMTTLGPKATFSKLMRMQGEIVREAHKRRTVRFETNGQSFFLKTHTGVGWPEIWKNLIYIRLPVLGANYEWHGIHHLRRLGIDTLSIAAYGTTEGAYDYARRQSFIVTDEITNAVSLEDFCAEWRNTPPSSPTEIRFKRWLIDELARIARTMHNSGANHRDFYLGHFLLQPGYESGALCPATSRLFIIDLHRMQLRRNTPFRWQVKDIAGLHYSSYGLNLTGNDRLRFIRAYRGQGLRQTLARERRFAAWWWRVLGKRPFLKNVESRARNLRRSEKRRGKDAQSMRHIGVAETRPQH